MWIVRKIRELRMVIENKLTMREVEKDPAVKDAKVPEELEKAIFDEIARIEERREKERQIIENLSPENRRLFHMGERYERSLHRRKYVIIAAVFVLALAFSINCFGSVDKMFHKLNLKIYNREREVADTDGVLQLEGTSEEEAFAKIEEMYGFHPVRLGYLPEGTGFLEVNILQDVPKITFLYGTKNDIHVKYDIVASYRDSSISKDIEDSLQNTYQRTYKGIEIEIKEYLVEDTEIRWLVQFEYENFYYWIQMMGIAPEEMQKIVEHINL